VSSFGGSRSFERRSPLPMTTDSGSSTAGSMSTGQPTGSPIGVIPPYSIPVSSTASSMDANDALRAPSNRRTTPFTSARVVARMTHAAYEAWPARLPAMTTQLADCSKGTS